MSKIWFIFLVSLNYINFKISLKTPECGTENEMLKATETGLLKVFLFWRFGCCLKIYVILRQVAY